MRRQRTHERVEGLGLRVGQRGVDAAPPHLGVAAGTYIDTFGGLETSFFTFDRIGTSFVGLWMLFFSVLVPARPREALMALLASGATVPLVYLVQVPLGAAPALTPSMPRIWPPN